MLNITTFLDANSNRLDKDVLYYPEKDKKYNSIEILKTISGIGRDLKERGIEKGDRVLIYLKNSPEYLFSLFALWRIGAIAIPTNRIYTGKELEFMISDCEAKLIITDEAGKDVLDIESFVIDNLDKYEESEILPPAHTSWDDLCQLQYTSGTTGKPKGSMLTHGNYFSAIHNECDVMGIKQDDVFLGIYPMAHVGLSWAISALRSGALYIMMAEYDFEEYLKLCGEEKVTVLTAMPPVIHSLTNIDSRTDLKTVREIISGGGPLHKKIWKKFNQTYHVPILNAYGLSETIVIGTGTVIRPEDYLTVDKYESVGHPVCFSEVKIVDELDCTKELDKYETGEIALRGPAVAKGYWGNEKATKEVFLEDGWFLTGDVGYLDEDNRLFITDRKKDMIVMSGWKIYPTEVEEELIKYPKVDEIAVFSMNDYHKGEIPVAAVVWKNYPDEDGLLEFARENLSRYKIPRKIFNVDELPRVNGWKLLRRELKEKYSK
ncbi:MAG: class I adenylate-forming enzyme family protein [Methanobrevibacter sp.]|uniref:class I adenylate-forming enzyme family protein n=1 Tax=Methanobrevibacter sp. TaxID=66852 RepID=UPI0026E03075|nr:class I adenylate-forming enzyme family protein [Methanobrevibacter sp.]MDO5848351.1 class I adenylate-forming enzyme family protein [Methanobrevibacter sp.]